MIFFKDRYRHGLFSFCESCKKTQKKYFFSDLWIRKKNYQSQNREKRNARRNEYIRKRTDTDGNFRLITKARCRYHHALKARSKSSSRKEILVIDMDTYRKWIEYKMTAEMNWWNIEIDHVKLICSFNVSNNEKLKEVFCWNNTQLLSKKNSSAKRNYM